jgi:preprotein translocase subunit SecA
VSVEVSETLARMLKRRGLKHEVLNAKYHEREAEIVAQAGRPGAITIATNMAGRGTDIKLGPGVKQCQVCGIRSSQAPFGQRIEPPDLTPACLTELGCNEDPPCGLVIVGTERHESRRIDRQLRGRSGRQGDPGQSLFFLSLEDDLMRLFGTDRIARWMDKSGAEENEVITHPWVTSAIGQAQKRVELQNFQQRKRLLEYDDVMNNQREVIYSLRRFALEGGEELKAEARRMVQAALERLAEGQVAEAEDPAQWDRDLMATEFLQRFLVEVPKLGQATDRAALVGAVHEAADAAFDGKLAYLKDVGTKVGAGDVGPQVLAQLTLSVIDEKWKDHLYDLDQLRAAIQYRAWGQKDPLIEYKQEAFEMFKGLMDDLRTTFAERWLKLQLEVGPRRAGPPATSTGPLGGHARRPAPMVAKKPDADGLVSAETLPGALPSAGAAVATPYEGVGRNDPCPCGSGKKFKKCHGAGL